MMIVKVVGAEDKNRINLERATREALNTLGIKATVEHVEDASGIAEYGVDTPAVVVNDKVVVSGRVPTGRQMTVILEGLPS